MKILFDSSYFMPLISIEVEKWSSEMLFNYSLNNKENHTLLYSDISLFEMAAKGMKIATNLDFSDFTSQDIQIGIDSLVNSSEFIKIPLFSHAYILELSSLCRKIHTDFIDCIIFSTAVCQADCLATYDHTFMDKIKESEEIKKKIAKINPNIKIQFDELSKPAKLLFPDLKKQQVI